MTDDESRAGPAILEYLLADAFDRWSYEDRAGREVISVEAAQRVAMETFQGWLLAKAAARQDTADNAPDLTARTMLLIRVDTIQQLVLEAAPDAS